MFSLCSLEKPRRIQPKSKSIHNVDVHVLRQGEYQRLHSMMQLSSSAYRNTPHPQNPDRGPEGSGGWPPETPNPYRSGFVDSEQTTLPPEDAPTQASPQATGLEDRAQINLTHYSTPSSPISIAATSRLDENATTKIIP